MIKLKMTKTLITLVFLALTSVGASAATIQGIGNFGTYIGTFNGTDSEAFFTNLDLDLNLVETIIPTFPSDGDPLSAGDLTIFNLVLDDNGGILGGEWSFSGAEVITHLVLNFGSVFSVYEFIDGANAGFFDTSDVLNKPIQGLSVYSSAAPVPLPAAVWLLLSGCVGLIGFGKRRS